MLLLLMASLLSAASSPDTTQTPLPFYPEPLHTVTVDGRALAYYDSGTDGPPLVLVHGLGSNLTLWREALPALADTYRVLAVDLPGYGLSDKADVPATMPFFADALAGFLDALALEQVHLVGLSMGGQISLTFALTHPDRLRRLVLVSPAGIETFTPEEAAALKGLFTPYAVMNTPQALYRTNVERNFAAWDERHAWLLTQREAVAARADFADYAAANARSVAGMLDGPVFDRLGEITVPTLVVFGRQDHLVPNTYLHPHLTTEALGQAAVEALPNARLQLVDDAGHLLPLEQPQAFHAALRGFLEEEAEE